FTSPLHVDAATSSPAAQSPVPQPPPVAAVIPEVPVAKPRDSPTSPRLHCLLHHLDPRCSGTSTTKQNPSIRLLLGRNAATKTSHGFLLHLRLLGCFSWGDIHDNERTIPPEFFDGKSASEHLDVYKYYRDWIMRHSGEIHWKKVAVYVGTMSEIDYAARFIKLAFAEQFLGPEEAGENGKLHMKEDKVITMPGGENVKEQDFPK
ncbi:hypothetical protein GW17_00005036, partial [Ensete ventricosum]